MAAPNRLQRPLSAVNNVLASSPGAMLEHHAATTKLSNAVPWPMVPNQVIPQLGQALKRTKTSRQSRTAGKHKKAVLATTVVTSGTAQVYIQSFTKTCGVHSLPPQGSAATSAYNGIAPAGLPKETLAAMEKLNAAAPTTLKPSMTPVTLPNGVRMNVPNADLSQLGLPSTPGAPVDANKLLGAPVTLPGTPEHYKDVTSRIMSEQATVGAQMQQVQAVESQHAKRAAYLAQ